MKIWPKIFMVILLVGAKCFAQSFSCPSGLIYTDGPGSFIRVYNPSLPLSNNNPSTTAIPLPSFGGTNCAGLALMPNINGGTLSPTFYTTLMGTYWWWDGITWINTGHSAGPAGAVNIAGCGSYLYNLQGITGQVYVYNGLSSSTLLTTLSGFNGGGPFDLVADCSCNFYALNTAGPVQALTLYNQSGIPVCNYSLSGIPATSSGGGLAIIGNKVYVKNSVPNLYSGTIGVSSVNFSLIPGFTITPTAMASDFASCPVCNTVQALNTLTITPGGNLDCITPSLNLTVNGPQSVLNYSWTGPGIIGSSNSSVVAVNVQGTYSCVVSTNNCPPQQTTLTSVVASNSTIVTAIISPSGNICLNSGTQKQFTVSNSSPTHLISWSGPPLITATGNNATVDIGAQGSYTVLVTDPYSGCNATDVVNLAITPTVNLALSTNSLCAQPHNGSPNTITITPSGASSYSMQLSAQFAFSALGSSFIGSPQPPFATNSVTSTISLTGSNWFCSDTTTSQLTVIPNPTINVIPLGTAICAFSSQQINVSGASTYSWNNVPGLNSYVGSTVVATPPATTVYQVFGSLQGCNSSSKSSGITVKPLPSVTVSPVSASVCAGNSLSLTAGGTATSYTWMPAQNLSAPNNPVTVASPTQSQFYFVIGALNSCTTANGLSVTVLQPPVISLALSSESICSHSYNNSPNRIIATPSGAFNYTLNNGPGFSVTPSGTQPFTITATGNSTMGTHIAHLTLQANNGICSAASGKTFAIIANPVLLITPPSATVCMGNSQSYSVSGATSYTWNQGPNLTLQTPSCALVSSTLNSFYSVRGSSVGCFSDVRNAVHMVTPFPTVAINAANFTVCAGGTVAFHAQSNATSVNWFSPGNVFSGSGSSVIVQTAASAQYSAVASINTCTSLAVTTLSTINVPDILVAAVNTVVCSGMATELSAQGAQTYVWSPKLTLNQVNGAQVKAFPTGNTTYTVQGYNGLCTGKGTIEINVIEWPNIDVESNANTICRGGTLWLGARGAQSYTWLPSSSVWWAQNNTNVVVKPESTTNYTIIGANHSGTTQCVSVINYSVIVTNGPEARTSGNTSICLGQKTTLRAYDGHDFKWMPDKGLNSNMGSAVVASPTVSTIYTLEASIGGYCSSTATLLVEVVAKPFVLAGRDSSYNQDEPVIISASGTGSLTWISGDGISCRECPTTTVYPKSSGCYVVEVVNQNNCVARDEVCITINKDFTIYCPDSFTPNNDGLNDEFLIYGENLSNFSISIYDQWGQIVFKSFDQGMGWNGKINGEDCKTDVYVYHTSYKAGNGKNYTKTGRVTLLR